MDHVNFKYANRVHPLMQKRVETLLQELKKDPNIQKIVLFGSSLDFRCNSQSDIDLYIQKKNSDEKLTTLPDLDCEIDIITNLPSDSKLFQEIDRTGLLLFERSSHV